MEKIGHLNSWKSALPRKRNATFVRKVAIYKRFARSGKKMKGSNKAKRKFGMRNWIWSRKFGRGRVVIRRFLRWRTECWREMCEIKRGQNTNEKEQERYFDRQHQRDKAKRIRDDGAGKKITAILDTGSPITILPRSYRRLINPKENSEPPTDWKFVDLNGNEVKIRNVFQLETSLNAVTKEILWWEVKAKAKAIVGMDNFELLGLKIMQNRKDGRQSESRQMQMTKVRKFEETLLNAVLSPEKSTEAVLPETWNSDSNKNTPQVSPVKSAKRKIAGVESLVAISSNSIQLYQQPTSLPPVGTILPPLVRKKTSNQLKNMAQPKNIKFT